MSPAEITALVVAIGGLPGLGALITALATLRKTTKVQADTAQLRPNHGSSVADKLDIIETMIRSQGHQLGEQHRLIMSEIADRQALATRAELEHQHLRDHLKACPLHRSKR